MAETISTTDRSGNLAATPLLNTKLFIPQARQLQDILPRPRLVERLQKGLSGRLTLISAPAGFGKSTLLTEWIPHSDRCVCWLSLDEADNDLARFLTYFIAALQGLQADFGRTLLVVLQTPNPPAVEALMTALVNEINHTLAEFALFLDDYHLIELPAIHTAVTFLLNNLPPKMHLILTSRADPPLPLARLRARRHLNEFRAADLRFTPDEAAAFLNEVMGLSLSAEDITTLETRTEGWIAGLQLAALSIQGRQDVASFIQAFSGSHIFIVDYLVEEVLQRQPAHVQTFLTQTSILDRLSGPLCEAVVGDGRLEIDSKSPISNLQSQAMLEQLERANLFVIPLDDERRWYRYHHLFAEVLRARLGPTHSDQVRELHRRASRWYEHNGLIAEAVQHALTAGTFEQAARLIEQMGLMVFSLNAMRTVEKWLEVLPAELKHIRPKLCLIQAWLLLNRADVGAALHCVEEAEQGLRLHFKPDDEATDTQNTQGEIAATRAVVLTYQPHFDPAQVNILAQEALAHLHPDNEAYQAMVYGALGTIAMRQGDIKGAEQAFAKNAASSRAGGNVYLALSAIVHQVNLQRMRGALSLAISTCQQALAWVAEGKAEATLPAGGLAIHLADLLREQNDLATAWSYATSGMARCPQAIYPHLFIMGSLVQIRLKQAMGDLAGAFELVSQLQHLAHHAQSDWALLLLAAVEGQLYLAQGNLLAALQCAQDATWEEKALLRLPASLVLIYASEYGPLTQAQIRLAQGRATANQSLLREVTVQLEQQHQAAQTAGLLWPQIKAQALQALAYHALGDLTSALATLERALTLAEPEGYIRVFVDEGVSMAQLLYQAARAGLAPAYTGQLLAAFTAARSESEPIGNWSQRSPVGKSTLQNLIEPLSEREREVLQLIADGLSDAEIARKLFLSPSTVKRHAHNIYSKLGVSSRTQAVARSRTLGILPPG